MHKGLLSLLLLAVLMAGCFSGGATETETGTAQLTGKVEWPDGSPAIGARVRLRSHDFVPGSLSDSAAGGKILGDTLTDSKGRYAFTEVPVGVYQVEALYSEGYGAVIRIQVQDAAKRVALDATILQSILTVTGRVAFSDSSLAPARVHVLGTDHWALADSATGLFTLREMPPGIFDLRVTTPMPFFPAKDFPGRVLEGPSPARIGDLVLDRGPKQAFTLDGGKLALAGIGSGNPVIYDNDYGTNTWDNEFLWSLASLGRVDLRGNLVTVVQQDIQAAELSKWSREAAICRLSGMRNIPEPMLGATRMLALPPSGRWQDILPESNPGVQLLVAEARKASVEKPLVVVASGELTTVANALLLDPYIADKMVVFGLYNHTLNGKDTLASFLVARKCRFVEWGRDYFWSGPLPSTAPIPGNWLGLRLDASRDSATFAPLFFADFAALSFLVESRSWTDARGAQALSAPLNASFGAAAPFDFIDIPRDANDWALMDRVFFATLADSGAYHPWPVPGAVAGVSFRAMSGAALDSVAGEGDVLVDIGPADWVEYALEAPTDGNYDLVLRYRGVAPARVQVSGQGGSTAELSLPTGSAWLEARTRLSFTKGVQSVRLSTVTGTWQLSRLQWERVP